MKKLIVVSVSTERLDKLKKILEPIFPGGFYTNITDKAVKEVLMNKGSEIILITGSIITPVLQFKIAKGVDLILWAKRQSLKVKAIMITCDEVYTSSEYSLIKVEDPRHVNEEQLLEIISN